MHLVAGADLDTFKLHISMQAVPGILDIDGAGHLDRAAADDASPSSRCAVPGGSGVAKAARWSARSRQIVDAPAGRRDRPATAGRRPNASGGRAAGSRSDSSLRSRARPRSTLRRKPLVPGGTTWTRTSGRGRQTATAPSGRSMKRYSRVSTGAAGTIGDGREPADPADGDRCDGQPDQRRRTEQRATREPAILDRIAH